MQTLHRNPVIEPWIRTEADAVRERLAGKGYIVTDAEYERLLLYSDRKRHNAGKEPEYLVLLIEDEIRDKCFRDAINAASMRMLALA